MKYLIPLLILLSSCMTVKRIEKNCDLFQKICLTEKDTVFITKEIEVIYRDTIVKYFIKRDTVHWTTPVYIRQGLMNSDLSFLETGLAKSTAQVKSGILKHFLQSGDTTLQLQLDNALRDIRVLNTRLEKKQRTITVKENSSFAIFALKWFWISFFVILILTLIAVFKNKLLGFVKGIL